MKSAAFSPARWSLRLSATWRWYRCRTEWRADMGLFPIFLKLAGRMVLVVGGGTVAEAKIQGLLAAGAGIRVVAPQITPQIAEWVRLGRIEWLPRTFAPDDLLGSHMVIAATSAPGVNNTVFREAEARRILCNAVDDNKNCHFYYGAVVRRGDLQIAISTNGKSPALAHRLRKELERAYGEEYAAWLDFLGAARDLLRANASDPEEAKAILHQLASRESFETFLRESSGGQRQKEVA
ncbi:MAG: siroheme synthase [Proteobacteria bacterium]|nr:MAG: siroheme synthase [Pseudomonadota bacterium]